MWGVGMKKILIVSPYFPPINTADMQRVRMLLPFFQRNGWQPEVLVVSPDRVSAPLDPWLVEGLDVDLKVHRANALGIGWSRIPGLGTLGFRALWPMAILGDSLLVKGDFDLVYFSTTVFEIHILGPRWKRKFGVPFVMDYQDLWVNDYYREHPEIRPPGGRLKYMVAEAIHRWMEPYVLQKCSGITSVSPGYPKKLAKRYAWFDNQKVLVQPFPGAARDFERLSSTQITQSWFDPKDGYFHWVYVGRGGPDMIPVLRALFKSIVSNMQMDKLSRLKFHFIGTSYAPKGRATPQIMSLAEEFGLADRVQEHSERIPYSEGLKCLTDADALLVIGSDDPDYSASKIYPYLLARKPLLAIFNKNSNVIDLLDKVRGAVCISFKSPLNEDSLANDITKSWFSQNLINKVLPLDDEAFIPYRDKGSAEILCRFLSECISND